MGGSLSEEFQAVTDIGEDNLVLCDHCDYASNLEVSNYQIADCNEDKQSLELVKTPESKTIEEVAAYLNIPTSKTVKAMLMNVDGEQFISLLHANKTFQALLAGMNMAIDMDNIIKSFDGDVVICLPDIKGKTNVSMAAELKRKSFLDDVGYWKQSCPEGSKITDWNKDAYCYTNGEMSYYFGVTPDMQFYSGSTADDARGLLSKSSSQLPTSLQDKIKGRRLAVVLNIRALFGGNDFVSDMLGGINTVLYVMK